MVLDEAPEQRWREDREQCFDLVCRTRRQPLALGRFLLCGLRCRLLCFLIRGLLLLLLVGRRRGLKLCEVDPMVVDDAQRRILGRRGFDFDHHTAGFVGRKEHLF
eukprot:6040499-Prymnesium_polylepis.1